MADPNLGVITRNVRLWGLANEAATAPSVADQINAYLAYRISATTPNPSDAEIARMRNLIIRNPLEAGVLGAQYRPIHQASTIAEVTKDPSKVIKRLNQSDIKELALPYLGAGDTIYTIGSRVLQANDGIVGRGLVTNMYGASFKEVADIHPTRDLMEILEVEVAGRKIAHMTTSLGYDATSGNVNAQIAANFIAPHITTNEQKFDVARKYETTTA